MSPTPRLRARGKVRDIYDAGDDRLLLVATDRISAFDVVLPDPIPDKGRVLTGLSSFWFDRTADLVPNHVVSDGRRGDSRRRSPACRRSPVARCSSARRRSCRWSAWRAGTSPARAGPNTQRTGAVCGVPLPGGLVESDRLPEPIFTPTSKAEAGHDLPLTPEEAVDLVGKGLFERLKELTLGIYERLADTAASRGILLADTKFEFGFADGELILIDEVGTPDSSRFWPADGYAPGGAQPSFDKQFVRDHLDRSGWDREPPAPALPPRGRRGHEGAIRRGVRADHRRVVRGLPRPRRGDPARRQGARRRSRPRASPGGARMRFAVEVLVTLKPGLADPQGKAVEGALPALGWTNVSGVRVGKHVRLEVEAGSESEARTQVEEMSGRLLSNPVIEDSRILEVRGAVSARIGVVTFPGSLDDRDALRAVELMGGEGVPLWHADPDLEGVDGVILPGGFSYGDYLRCGAIARFAPVMEEIRGFAARGGPVLGICNGFQILCESGLLPGALIRNRSLRFVCRNVHLRVETTQTPVTADVLPGEVLEMPIKHGEGQFVASEADLDRLEDDGRVVFRYCGPDGVVSDAHNPNGALRGIAGIRNEAGNVVGLMPHPEHAVDPDVGPTGGQALFASLLSSVMAGAGR